jgi:hypothetical protein
VWEGGGAQKNLQGFGGKNPERNRLLSDLCVRERIIFKWDLKK